MCEPMWQYEDMKGKQMAVKFRVFLMESERGWSREEWHEDYPTEEQARERIREVNSRNTTPNAPDWYMVADQHIELVEE